MQLIRAKIDQIPPKHRRYLVLGVGGSLVVAALWFFASGDDQTRRTDEGESVIENVLTDADTRAIGVDSLSARMDRVQDENKNLKREVERLKKNEQRLTARDGGVDQLAIERIERKLNAESEARKEFERRMRERTTEPSAAGVARADGSPLMERPESAKDGIYDDTSEQPAFDPSAIFKTPAETSEGESTTVSNAKGDRDTNQAAKIVTIVEDEGEVPEEEGTQPNRTYLAAGSIVSGTNITGMDAPTGQAARRDPFPLLLRVKPEAILPNRFRQDIKECFLLASGYGDLSSERAYLRAETISCVRDDGGVIEQSIKAYATGEDGKAGIRGRLVSKQGQVIANSMMAGFLGGVAEAFDVNPVPTINTSNDGQQEYQRVLSRDAMQGAAVSGTSSALDRIAQFYIDMAEDMYPVIEINAGRNITFIVQSGVSFDVKK